MEQLLNILRLRSSCRYFKRGEPLSKEEITTLLRSIDLGPSAGGLYAYSVYHTSSQGKKNKIQKLCLDQGFISDCSIIFLLCASPDKNYEKYGERGSLYAIQDATIAGMNITVTATTLWLGSCWVGSIDQEGLGKVFKVKKEDIPLSIICIGRRREYADPQTGQSQSSSAKV